MKFFIHRRKAPASPVRNTAAAVTRDGSIEVTAFGSTLVRTRRDGARQSLLRIRSVAMPSAIR